jgi:hypothetical protein
MRSLIAGWRLLMNMQEERQREQAQRNPDESRRAQPTPAGHTRSLSLVGTTALSAGGAES